ncbi:MAG: TetR/AcrR family transcriptional regulator [Bacteroidetes bacterium]|nr:TetR/AcrR family transcriptional regulator [Bacteroidota bacterium]MBU1717905.1 TetR/AcrR family transcriptional regulator [Bacteroidota bacterium]
MGIPERKEREKEQRRNAIVDAAEKIFFTKGFQESTMDDIANEAELSKGTLYLYFKSKEDLLFAVLIRGTVILNEILERVIDPDITGRDNLLIMADAFIKFSKEHNDHFNLFMRFQSKDLLALNINVDDVFAYLRDQSPLTILGAVVMKGISDGSLRNDIAPELLAATLWSQMLGILMVAYNKKDVYAAFGIDHEALAKVHLELVLNGIIPTNG